MSNITGPRGSDPATATCPKCKKEHQTTVYMANRYPNRSCKKCVHEEEVKEYQIKAEQAVSALNFVLKDGRSNLRASLKIEKRLEIIK